MLDQSAEIQAYAAYINASIGRPFDDPDEQDQFDQDLQKAKAAMERAWLESTPTKEKP